MFICNSSDLQAFGYRTLRTDWITTISMNLSICADDADADEVRDPFSDGSDNYIELFLVHT